MNLTPIVKPLLPTLVYDAVFNMWEYKCAHGRFPNIFRPKSFSEKILCRTLFDRDPLLEQFTDKLAVRSYVESKIGSAILPKLYWSTKSPSDIPFDSLPDAYVAKPNHGAGWVKLVRDKTLQDRDELVAICEGWLKSSLYGLTHERIYRNITPTILVEEFIGPTTGGPPNDYKFYVFDGRVEMVEMLSGRFNKLHSNLFDRSWKKLDVEYNKTPPVSGGIPKPKHLDEMIRIAETLARDSGFLRVDLYDTGERIYFGELTVSSGGGLDRFIPASYDLYLGSLWPPKNKSR